MKAYQNTNLLRLVPVLPRFNVYMPIGDKNFEQYCEFCLNKSKNFAVLSTI